MKRQLVAWSAPATLALCLAGAQPAAAQQFGNLQGLGDSASDTGRFLRTLRTVPFPFGDRFSNGPIWLDQLPSQVPVRFDPVSNLAFGAATTGPSLLGLNLPFGFLSQVAELERAGARFAPNDLIGFSIGGNDATAATNAGVRTQAGLTAAAQQSAANVGNGVQRLVNLGARNFVVIGLRDLGNTPPSFPAVVTANPAERTTFAAAYNDALQRQLAPIAAQGARIHVLDTFRLVQQVQANPQRYGFDNATVGCSVVPSCLNGPRSAQDRFYFWDLHTSTAGYRLIAAYAGAMLRAPYTVAATADLAAAGARNFTDSVRTRLDTSRLGLPGGAAGGNEVRVGRFALYATGTGGFGAQDTRSGAYGHSFGQGGVNIGAETALARNLRAGAVFGYSRLDAKLTGGQGDASANLYNLGLYATGDWGPAEADALLAYGWQSFDRVRRPPVVDERTQASPDARTFSAALRGAYMIPVSPALRIGPTLGLAYANTELDAYTESGDVLVAQRVERQRVEALIGSVGGQVRAASLVGRVPVVGRLALAYEHDFVGSGRTVTTTFVTSPLLPIRTDVSGLDRNWGRIAAGVAAQVAPRVSLGLEVQSTFARHGGDVGGVFATLRVSL